MRKGLLGSVAALLTGTGLVFGQAPYGYVPVAQPYAPSYGYYAYPYAQGYPANYGYSAGYGYQAGYAPGYAAGYGQQPAYTPAYPAGNARQPAASTAPAPMPEAAASEISTSAIPSQPMPTGPAVSQPTAQPIDQAAPLPNGPVEQIPSPVQPGDKLKPTIETGPDSSAPEPIGLPKEPLPGGMVMPDTIDPATPPVVESPGSLPVGGDAGRQGPRTWASAEFLLWQFKDAPLPVPVATLGQESPTQLAAVPFIGAGALGQAGTTVLSPDRFNYPYAPGGRVTLGGWLDSEHRFGLEASGFLFAAQNAKFYVASGAPNAGSTALSVPFFDAGLGTENALQLTDPLGSPNATQGSIAVDNTIQLWGTEVNGLYGLVENDWIRIRLLAGVRYLDLDESLSVTTTANNNGMAITLPPNSYINSTDRFGTRNQFYGGQVGMSGELRWGSFFVDATGKVAIGPMHEVANVSGLTTSNFNGVTGLYSGTPIVTPAGVFAQATNIGRQSQDQFGVVPEVRADFGVDLWERVRLSVGYDFLYMNTVLRPGDQIDRQINTVNVPPPGAAFLLPRRRGDDVDRSIPPRHPHVHNLVLGPGHQRGPGIQVLDGYPWRVSPLLEHAEHATTGGLRALAPAHLVHWSPSYPSGIIEMEARVVGEAALTHGQAAVMRPGTFLGIGRVAGGDGRASSLLPRLWRRCRLGAVAE